MSAPQNMAGYRLTLEGRDLGLGDPLPASALATLFGGQFAAMAAALMGKIGPRLISLTLTEKRGEEADQLDIVIHDHDGAMDIPKPGAVLSLALGWVAGYDVAVGLVEKGRFKVDEAEWSGPPDIITIRARAADFAAAINVRQERSATGKTLGEIIGQIAARQGYAPMIDPALAAKPVPVLAQDQESDAALLRRLGRRFDATATVKDGRLIFAPIGAGKTASGKALPPVTITRRSGDGYTYRRAERDQASGVEARWHDAKKGERKTVAVGSAPPAPGNAGAQPGKPRRLKRIYASEAEAKTAADTEQQRIKRAAASFDIALALGDPSLFPERPASVAGFKAEVDAQKWLIAEVTHTLDAGGLMSKLKLEAGA